MTTVDDGRGPAVRGRRAALESCCKTFEVPPPHVREARARWMDRVARSVSDGEHLDRVWSEPGLLHLSAAWDAAGDGNTEATRRHLEAAADLLAIARYVGSEDGLTGPRSRLQRVWETILRSGLGIESVGADRALVALEVDGGVLLDDGTYREGFERRHVAESAVDRWRTRPRTFGRGLPYVDTEERRDERVEEARSNETPLERLLELAGDSTEEVLEALAQRERLPAEVARAMHQSLYGDLALSYRADIPSDVADRIVRGGEPNCIGSLALAGHDIPSLLEALRSNSEAREYVFDNWMYAKPGIAESVRAVLEKADPRRFAFVS